MKKHLEILRYSQWLPRAVIACMAVIAASLIAGCGGSGNGTASTTSFATAYAGNWTGTWTDIDGTSGTSTMVIALNSATKSASVSITLSGGQFGFVGGQTALTGTYDSNSITLNSPTGQSASAKLVIDKSGQFTGSVTNVSANVTSITYAGPSTPQSVTLNVVVHHADGTTDTGTVTLTKSTSTT
jgi:hypothetical protein